ncbi:nucleocytoplasmic transporter [Malassezia pachydermatis]
MSTPAWLMDFTSNAAETFVTAYYAASDSPQRAQLLPSLYLPNSSISWNGNPISGTAHYAQWLDAQPGSQHEIQSFDCHPLGPYNAHEQNEAPSLLLTVSGTVAHYTPESLLTKPGNAPKSASATGSSKKKFDADAPLESHPRVFSQTFVLINGAGTNTEGGVPFVWTPPKSTKNKNQPQTDARTVAKYFVQADSFRFVG